MNHHERPLNDTGNHPPHGHIETGPGLPDHAASGRLGGLLVAWRWPLMVVGLAAAAISFWPAQQLAFDRSVENMFAPDDPLLAPYHKLQRTFGGNEVALAAYDDPQLLTQAGMDRLEELTAALEHVPGVSTVFSLTRSPLLGKQLISWPVKSQRDAFIKVCEGYTVSADHRTAAVICVFAPESENSTPRTETVDLLREQIDKIAPGGVLTGEPVMVVDGFRYLDEDGQRLGVASTFLLSLIIVLCFRSLRWVIVPMAVVYTALLITEAILVASGFRMSMVSSMLWAILAVIGIATVVHVVIGFRELRGDGLLPPVAMRATIVSLAGPVFWACTTDLSGFGSLTVSRVGPVHDFGIMMSLGAMATLASIILLVPGLSLFGRWDVDPHRAWGEQHLDLGLHRLSSLIERRPKLLALLVVAITGPPVLGSWFLEAESDFTKNFRRSSPIVGAYNFVESKLGGAGVWDVIVPVPTTSDPDFLPHVRKLEDRLRSEVKIADAESGEVQPGLTKVLSVVDALDGLVPGAKIDANKLEATLAPLKKQMPIVALLDGRDPRDGNRQWLRIMLRSRERQGSKQKEELIRQVTDISQQEFPEAQVTGFFVLLTRLIESMLGDQWTTFVLSTSGIFLMMLAAFRSVQIALITLVPNALPIMVVMGLLGWLGLKMNMGAAMIAAVSMGLAVDSSAHYIYAFREYRALGQSIPLAMRSVHQSVGRAVVFSTLALIVGFTALCVSQFIPTIYFGVLVSLAMIGGAGGNLVVLPLLLKFVLRKELAAERAAAGHACDAAHVDAKAPHEAERAVRTSTSR
ncbi:MAG: RND family transporter [Planctomycetia bacterium]|nr:RND family transporter [Planctomycetia bacterium]